MTTPSNKPTHAVFHVRGGDKKTGKKGFWTKVGAAWLHADNEGMNLQLDYIPVGERVNLTVRVINDGDESNQGEAA